MKVVDMFGCQLPVCAVGFSCLDELVQHGRNGLVFKDSAQLATQLQQLLKGFPVSSQLNQLRAGVAADSRVTWDANWNAAARPLFAAAAGI